MPAPRLKPMFQAPPPRPPRMDDSDAWEIQLVDLLARLEHHWSGAAGKRLGPDARLLLDRAAAMIRAADEVARKMVGPGAEAPGDWTAALAKAGAFSMAADKLRAAAPQGVWAAVVRRGGPPPAEVRHCLLTATESLHGYFVLFMQGFGPSTAARGWSEAASGFLAEFERAVRAMPE